MTTSNEEGDENNDEMKCFCWKEKRRKRRGRRLFWEGGGGNGTAGHFGNQPPKKYSEAAPSPHYSVPVVSPTGAMAVVAVVLFGKLTRLKGFKNTIPI